MRIETRLQRLELVAGEGEGAARLEAVRREMAAREERLSEARGEAIETVCAEFEERHLRHLDAEAARVVAVVEAEGVSWREASRRVKPPLSRLARHVFWLAECVALNRLEGAKLPYYAVPVPAACADIYLDDPEVKDHDWCSACHNRLPSEHFIRCPSCDAPVKRPSW